MPEKRENSVLFSLRELRQIEDDRVRSEEQAIRQREEEERTRAANEERRRRDEIERVRREAEEAERARVEAEETRQRNERLRLEEAERVARIDAQARLEEQRLRMEIDARAREASTRKAKILVASTAAAFFVVAVTGIFAYRAYDEREKQAQINEENARKRQELETFIAQKDKEIAEIFGQIEKSNIELEKTIAMVKAAKNADERRIAEEHQAAVLKAKYEQEARAKELQRQKALGPVDAGKCKNSNDPLCGIGR